MGLFHQQTRWERLINPIAPSGPQALVKGALATAATLATVTAASAVVSTIRRHKDEQ